MSKTVDVVRLKPYQYIHVHDNNKNVSRVLVGPLSYTRLDHEMLLQPAPQQCICLPTNTYCIVENPVVRTPAGALVMDQDQVKLAHGEQELRFAQEPFPLYPGEVLAKDVTPLPVLSPLQAFRVRAVRDVPGADGKPRKAGDEWIVSGPLTYVPHIAIQVVEEIQAVVIRQNQALKLKARARFTDASGVDRIAGSEWLITKPGAYIPDVEEEIVEMLTASVLTTRRSLHVEALASFTDRFKKARKTGERWLITLGDTEYFIPSPNEKIVATVDLTVVGSRQYCVVQDFVGKDGRQNFGRKELRTGLCKFFLHPGESLEDGKIKNIYVLGADEALLLSAVESFTDETGTNRLAGSFWMIAGPRDYIPPVAVVVKEKRRAIPLDANEGVYIRNIRTGVVRAHIGKTILLNEDEELWEKQLPPLVEELLGIPRLTKIGKDSAGGSPTVARNKNSVVSCNIPHNALVQVYDYTTKRARVIFGPDQVMLMPDEEFTVVSLSGGKPKSPDVIKSLCLSLGPDFMTDIVVVETLDHARLQLQLSYNWEFDRVNIEKRAFSVPDFVGDACKAIASRIRGVVAGETFDAFHKHSASIIRRAVFGERGHLEFTANGLIVTNVDIHSVDPVDPKTREALTKSVQLAIEITTKSQEAAALQQATSLEQEAKGKLERQIIEDRCESEKERMKLLEIEASNAAVESTGASKAQSSAQAASKLIEGENEVTLAEVRSKAQQIMVEAELQIEQMKQEVEIEHRRELYRLHVARAKGLAMIEADKFAKVIAAVGKDTIKSLARAGPDMQSRLLKSLGLQGYLVTDGSNPINLFNTANGLTAAPTAALAAR